jgi:hypothetical protein
MYKKKIRIAFKIKKRFINLNLKLLLISANALFNKGFFEFEIFLKLSDVPVGTNG